MKRTLMILGLLLTSTVWASDGSYEIDVFVCDICNFASALELAKKKAPPVVCSGGITHTDQPVCSAEVKELIVANPVAQTAHKFRVQRPHPHHFGQSQQLELNWGEQQMINRFFDIDREIREAVWAINGELGTSSNRQPARAFDYGSSTAAFANAAEAECQNSAAAHAFSSRTNRERLQNVVRRSLINEIGRRTWREYVSEAELSEISAGGSMTVTAGFNPLNSGASASVHGNMKFDIVERPVILRALGGRSCTVLDRWICSEDYDNVIQYVVTFTGNFDVRRDLDIVNLELALHAGTSIVDGERVSVILAEGSGNFVADLRNQPPESCLAQLLKEQLDNYEQGLPNDIVAAEPIGPGLGVDFGDGLGNRQLCVQTVTVNACTGEQGGRMVCRPTTFRSYRQCD